MRLKEVLRGLTVVDVVQLCADVAGLSGCNCGSEEDERIAESIGHLTCCPVAIRQAILARCLEKDAHELRATPPRARLT
jgi:hypothetical protein